MMQSFTKSRGNKGIKNLPNSEQSYKGKVKTHKLTDKISQQPENCENRNDPEEFDQGACSDDSFLWMRIRRNNYLMFNYMSLLLLSRRV